MAYVSMLGEKKISYGHHEWADCVFRYNPETHIIDLISGEFDEEELAERKELCIVFILREKFAYRSSVGDYVKMYKKCISEVVYKLHGTGRIDLYDFTELPFEGLEMNIVITNDKCSSSQNRLSHISIWIKYKDYQIQDFHFGTIDSRFGYYASNKETFVDELFKVINATKIFGGRR